MKNSLILRLLSIFLGIFLSSLHIFIFGNERSNFWLGLLLHLMSLVVFFTPIMVSSFVVAIISSKKSIILSFFTQVIIGLWPIAGMVFKEMGIELPDSIFFTAIGGYIILSVFCLGYYYFDVLDIRPK